MSAQHPLSVVVIVNNCADVLTDCLASVNWAEEIIVLDSGSSDQSQQIARQCGAKVYQNLNWQGFGKQRQLAQSYASGEYILMLDADERVSPALREEIESLLARPELNDNQVYTISRSNLFLGRFMRHSGWYPDRVIRLYANQKFTYDDALVHESLNTKGATITALRGDLLHLTCRDLFTFQRKQLSYAEAWAKQRHQQGKQCHFLSIFTHTLAAFCKSWLWCAGFLDGKQGLLLAMVNAQYTFNKYAALWALCHSMQKK
jgi:(heptosyl)LPS beta-1,4-glucosyltransferase